MGDLDPILGPTFVSDIAIFVLKRDVKLQPSNRGPTRVHNASGILIRSAFFCTVHGRVSIYSLLYKGTPFPKNELSLLMGYLDPI